VLKIKKNGWQGFFFESFNIPFADLVLMGGAATRFSFARSNAFR